MVDWICAFTLAELSVCSRRASAPMAAGSPSVRERGGCGDAHGRVPVAERLLERLARARRPCVRPRKSAATRARGSRATRPDRAGRLRRPARGRATARRNAPARGPASAQQIAAPVTAALPRHLASATPAPPATPTRRDPAAAHARDHADLLPQQLLDLLLDLDLFAVVEADVRVTDDALLVDDEGRRHRLRLVGLGDRLVLVPAEGELGAVGVGEARDLVLVVGPRPR